MCRYCFEVYQHADFAGDWAGWRLRGRDLISPDGDRVNAGRLRGLLTVEALRGRRSGFQGAVVLSLPQPEPRASYWHAPVRWAYEA